MKLYHYSPRVKDPNKYPILIVYALVNKQYMMDLQEDRSLIRNLLKGGQDIYIIDWGYPTQDTVVKELFADPDAAASTVFAKEVGTDKAKTMVEPIVADANPSINGVDKSMSDSTVYVTAKTAEGGDVQYKVSLVRDMIGWKVSNVELYFPSQN